MALISLGVAAEILGISRTSAQQLSVTGVLGPITMRGNRGLTDLETVQELAGRPVVDQMNVPSTLVVRLGKPALTTDTWREHIGWSETWSAKEKQDAVRGDWKIRAGTVPLPCSLVAAVGPVVVAVYTALAGAEHNGRLRLAVVAPQREAVEAFSGKLLRLPAGPVIMRLGV